MRKALKTTCLETTTILQDAQAEIESCIGNGDYEQAVVLLEECQQGAIELGNAIEESEGKTTAEVHVLEAYCEKVFTIHEALLSPDKKNGNEDFPAMLQEMRRHLLQVADGIRSLPDTKEVVFLPYKASMWDSLEPVWRKMQEEPDIRTIVMPIPYYDKNPDGTVRELHYEGELYPDDVPVTSFRSYSLKDRHPDAIYIHNPYDDANFVTSVLPDFYSSVIKQYTDELVYIPYFVYGEIDPDNQAALDGNSNIIVLPAVIHAHKVIVQSENWRKAYIEVMTATTGEKTRSYWENKIEAGGSPKLERLEELTEADFDIPEEWKCFIYREDGSRRKVIFYNTALGAMLRNDEAMLDKIERNLEVFLQYQNDVALLWRPHPLLEATLQSMRPQLFARYKDIVGHYRKEGRGIFDESAELHRAIVVSDAYYGDPSSVETMFQQVGKPTMIQNASIRA